MLSLEVLEVPPVEQAANKLSKQKISIRDFSFELEDTFEELEDGLDDLNAGEEKETVVAVAKEFLDLLRDKVAFMRNP